MSDRLPPHSSESEARYLHRELFGSEPEQIIVSRYAEFIQTLGANQSCSTTKMVMEKQLDAEAVCMFLTRWQPNHPLQQRFHGLCYLCEVRSPYVGCFYGQRRNLVPALLTLIGHGIRSIWKFLKGWRLVRQYDLT
jgi:hypothetical protein